LSLRNEFDDWIYSDLRTLVFDFERFIGERHEIEPIHNTLRDQGFWKLEIT
jgi:hypothetical protein